MKDKFETERLVLTKLAPQYASFIKELLNTAGWIKYIGDRNIKTIADAEKYIKNISDNPGINYWVVSLKATGVELGIITFIKKDYLEHHDIGFAFLPQYSGKGYAYEAADEVLNYARNELKIQPVIAVTIPENEGSIKLLKKLGFSFEKTLTRENEVLNIYTTNAN
jgi:ribosomal-protein-alanine N-acetyltransferase